MATIHELPSGSFRVQIRRKGVAAVGKTFKTRAEAEDWARDQENGLMGKHHQAAARVAADGLTFAELVQRYFDSPVFSGKAESTQSRERGTAKRLLEQFGSYGIGVIDSGVVQDYLDVRAKERKRLASGRVLKVSVSADTVRLEKALLSQLFKFAKRRKLVAQNIMLDSFDLPTCKPREGRITLQQQMRMFDAAQELLADPKANRSLLPWLFFVFETGTRPGEAAKAELEWFNLEARKVNIPRRGQKKRNPRVVLLSDELVEVLTEQAALAKEAGSAYMFFSRVKEARERDKRGQPVRRRRTAEETAARAPKPYAYHSSWGRLCARAGVPKGVNPHIVRHEFISRLFENTDLNDGQIAALVGDVNVLSLEPYKHLRVERLRTKQDAHMDELRQALEQLQAKRDERLTAHVRKVLADAQA